MASGFRNPTVWLAGTGSNRYLWTCLACKDNLWRKTKAAERHEGGTTHIQFAKVFLASQAVQHVSSLPAQPAEASVPPQGFYASLLAELDEGTSSMHALDPEIDADPGLAFDSDAFFNTLENSTLDTPNDPIEALGQSLHKWLAGGGTDSEHSDTEEDERPEYENISAGEGVQIGRQRARQRKSQPKNDEWYPWPDKASCVLDILRHLPRTVFSDRQMEIISWAMVMLGVNDLPSVDVMKELDSDLQAACGIESIRCQGKLGHLYYVNSLASIIAQEMANPRVRPHMTHYPEDSGPELEQSWQGEHWLNGIDPSLATPMLRINNEDLYVFEPAKLDDNRYVIPMRWFTRKRTDGQLEFFAKAHLLQPTTFNGQNLGWLVQTAMIEVPATQFVLSFPRLCNVHVADDVPDPRIILGFVDSAGAITQWTFSDPKKGNPWREKSRGHRVVSFMMWLYCDDTSGNVSKKWNKHNSFLFTAAGLPRSMNQQESNIHFLCTSNIAPPLEMLDGIVDQLEDGQTNGIWAWDCVMNEMVLVIPAVLALLGDNPMQSELACHIGLKGKFFCRHCWVRGADVADRELNPQPSMNDSDSDTSEKSTVSASNTKSKTRRQETLEEMVARAKRFVGSSALRTRDESFKSLRSMFQQASSFGGITAYKQAKTETGLKDTFLEHFVDKIFSVFRSRSSRDDKARRLKVMLEREIPKEPYSPVWRIKGLDPHRDTPVEILHVILLGFLKYFWRDAMARLNADQKKLLITRLNSFDVSGLGLDRLAGATLVNYAGSLTGRDFRAISQVAPFVLYDLVPEACYETWLAISHLVPLIWQPKIVNLDSHIVAMEHAIDYFLLCTARWTPRWFNKPKFHILKHLPAHVRRFGPAILFATEAFESFNAIIRAQSVHSNRHAPSRDIARGMARCNRVRHLLSGGFLFCGKHPPDSEDADRKPFSNERNDWTSAGPSALALCRPSLARKNLNVVRDALGLSFGEEEYPDFGTCTHLHGRLSLDWTQTASSTHFPTGITNAHRHAYNLCRSFFLTEGDSCLLNSFVLFALASGETRVGQVQEIVQVNGSTAEANGRANYVLVRHFAAHGPSQRYRFPSLLPAGWELLGIKDVKCLVNVQHNCYRHKCDDSSTETVIEEREATSRTRPKIRHHGNLNDVVLNLAQMRNSQYLATFRWEPPLLNVEDAILQGATAEIQARKAENKASGKNKSKAGSAGLRPQLLHPSHTSIPSNQTI